MERYALFRGFIVTANKDGSIPLSAKCVCQYFDEDSAAIHQMLNQANLYADFNDSKCKRAEGK